MHFFSREPRCYGWHGLVEKAHRGLVAVSGTRPGKPQFLRPPHGISGETAKDTKGRKRVMLLCSAAVSSNLDNLAKSAHLQAVTGSDIATERPIPPHHYAPWTVPLYAERPLSDTLNVPFWLPQGGALIYLTHGFKTPSHHRHRGQIHWDPMKRCWNQNRSLREHSTQYLAPTQGTHPAADFRPRACCDRIRPDNH